MIMLLFLGNHSFNKEKWVEYVTFSMYKSCWDIDDTTFNQSTNVNIIWTLYIQWAIKKRLKYFIDPANMPCLSFGPYKKEIWNPPMQNFCFLKMSLGPLKL